MISVITCSVDEARFKQVEAMYQRVFAGEQYELIRIADAKSLAEGYQRGVAQSSGEFVVLSHDDIEIISAKPAELIRTRLAKIDLFGVAGTTRLIDSKWLSAGPPYIFGQILHSAHNQLGINIFGAPRRVVPNIQACDGVILCARRSVFDVVQFDAATFDGFHLYDIDFTFAAHLAGLKLAVCNDLCVLHRSTGSYNQSWETFDQRFMEKRRSQLPSPQHEPGRFKWGGIIVKDIAEALQVMNPPYWDYRDE